MYKLEKPEFNLLMQVTTTKSGSQFYFITNKKPSIQIRILPKWMALALLIFSGSLVDKAEGNHLKITIKKMQHDSAPNHRNVQP